MPLNDSFWNNEQGHLLAILKPRLEQMAFDAAKQAAQKAGIGFNPNLANANAARWARDYTDNLLKQLGTTSIAGIGEMIAQWVETPGATYGQLQQSLIHYGEIRAQAIAVTETTRAYAEGEIMAYKQEGITQIRWNTNRDEQVCKTCGPLHGKVVKIGEEFGKDKKGNPIKNPPAHVSCRCSIVAVVTPNKERDAVFKPAGLPDVVSMVGEQLPLPQALGADASDNYVRQVKRYNEINQMELQDLEKRVSDLKMSNPIPNMEKHLRRHKAEFGITTESEYQQILDKHVQNPNLRVFTAISIIKELRVWYLVDVENKTVSIYDETSMRHYTLYRPENINVFFEKLSDWLVEIDKQSLKADIEWKP